MTFLRSASRRIQLLRKSLLALAVIGFVFPSASAAQQVYSASSEMAMNRSVTRNILEDGTYLFGQSPTPEQIGSAYAVLSVQDNQTVGAFYYPRSSFDCFSGEVLPDRLDVEVVNSYEQTTYSYFIALTLEESLVAGGAAGAYTLEGFHRIEDIGANDYKMLAVCQADLAQ